MMRKTCLTMIALAVLACPLAFAKAARVWTTAGAETYADGELDNVAVLSTGALEPAPATEAVPGIAADYVWDVEPALRDDDGNEGDTMLYIATGAPGALYRLQPGKDAELVHKTIEPHAMSVLPMEDGSVLLGTAPRGIIWRVQPDGSQQILADLDDAYVWDMAHAPDGGAYCATGPDGRLLHVSAEGQVEELARVQQSNIMCLEVNADGGIYFGTQPDGFLYHHADGRTRAVYDAEEDEIHDMFLEQDRVYFCTAGAGGNGNGRGGAHGPSGAASVPPDPQAGRYSNAPSAANSVYVLDGERGAVQLAQVQGKFFLSLARHHEGAGGEPVLLAGTGPGGRVLSISGEGVVKVLAATDAAQVTALVPAGAGVALATSNPGGLAHLRGAPAQKGTWTSKPFDAGYAARWGRVWWHENLPGEDDDIRVRMRTGVTAEPDDHWSDWTDWTSRADGAPVEVPLGRYAQLQVELTTGNITPPALLDVNVSYKQSNRRPVVQDFRMNGMSVLPQANGGNGQHQQRQPNQQPGIVMLDWQVGDPNNDDLVVDLHYRGVGEKDWKEIQSGIREQNNIQWDTNRLPAGHYLLRITAADAAVRGPDEALAGQRISLPQVIDNRRPDVVELEAERNDDGTYTITGTARDGYSRLINLFYSRNGGDWQDAFPRDGLLDSPEEALVFRTEVLEPGEHVFVVTALDQEHNPGSGKVIVNVPEQ